MAAFVLLSVLGMATIWAFDYIFNGVVVDFLESLVMCHNDSTGAVYFNTERVAVFGFLFLTLLALLLSATGAICAWRAHRRQSGRLERAQAEAERARQLAEREMQRKSDLITYLAHDLRTPLASVIAYLSLLEESPELTPAQRTKYTGVALEKACRLEQLVNELFEIIRFNLQSIVLNRENIRLRRMLEQLSDEFEPILQTGGRRISIDCPEEMEIFGDADKPARVFNNILKNAMAYSYPQSEIRISAGSDGEWNRISFSNDCDYIPAEELARLFDKFYRLDGARSSKTGGSGLGLAIAKEIVEAHGGAIEATCPGNGVVFTVRLRVHRSA